MDTGAAGGLGEGHPENVVKSPKSATPTLRKRNYTCNNRIDTGEIWRKRVGVEPTIRPANDRIAGFEGREGHRTNFASAIDSTDLSEQLEIGSKPPSRSFVSLSPQEPAKIFVLVGSKVIYTRSYGGGPASFHRFF